MNLHARVIVFLAATILYWGHPAMAQTQSSPAAQTTPVATAVVPAAVVTPPAVVPPPGYVIGSDDQRAIVFWREKDLSTETTVRPDGKISLPLLNDIEAKGLTPDELRARITEAAGKYVEDPTVTVVVKQINSRKVFITGQVGKPGPYPLGGPTTVLQLIATAGGVNEYADTEHIVIVRSENGKTTSLQFNYKDVSRRKKLQTNIELKPGDTVIVP